MKSTTELTYEALTTKCKELLKKCADLKLGEPHPFI